MRARLCFVRLGAEQLQAGYRRDDVASHWWLDLWLVRVCAIWRSKEAA